MRLRYSAGFAIALYLSGLFSSVCLAEPSEGRLRLATWNIEHLGVGEESCLLRSEQDFEALRAYARLLDADIVAIQEIASLDAAYRVFPEEEYTVFLASVPNTGKRALCWFEPPLTRDDPVLLGNQFTGFAIRKALVFEREPNLTGFGDTASPPGKGAYVSPDVRVRTVIGELRLLSLHLLWGCAGQADLLAAACQPLARQAQVLKKWLSDATKKPAPVALMGDFNREWGPSETYWQTVFGPDGAQDIKVSADHLETPCKSHLSGSPRWIDHIFLLGLPAGVDARFGSVLFVPFDRRNFKLSDHCPVYVDLMAAAL